MVDSKSDYKKSFFNLNSALPEVNKGDFLETLNENLFNRFLTPDEFDHIVGLIGDADPNERVSTQIKEQTPYRQNNQLQPVVSHKVGTVNHFMTFEDLMTRLGRIGVDTEKFNEWGNAMQFNWMPPIDIDKIINYRDYYWNTKSGTGLFDQPQYVVIKNQANWSAARSAQGIRSIVEISGSTSVVSYDAGARRISLSGNVTPQYTNGIHIILSMSNGENSVLTVQDAFYNIATANTDIIVQEFFRTAQTDIGDSASIVQLDVPIINNVDGLITLSGDYTKIMVPGYVLSVNAKTSETAPVISQTATVKTSEFNAVTNVTSLTISRVDGRFNRLSMFPQIASMLAERDVANDKNVALQRAIWSDNYIGQIMWYKNILLTQGNSGSTVFGNSTFTDGSRNFNTLGVKVGDSVEILADNKGFGTYRVAEVVDDSTLRLENVTFFSAQNISYKVLRDFSLKGITRNSQPNNPQVFDLWYNPTTDILYQYRLGSWNVCYRGLSALVKETSDRTEVTYSNKNDWSKDNLWLHKSQITTYTGLIRAQIPIIEFFPFLEMAEMSYSEKIWRYRKSVEFSYVDETVSPRMIEIMDFTYSGNEFRLFDTTTIIFNEKYGNFGSQLKAGDKIRLSGFAQNEGLYTVASTSYEQVDQGQRFATTIKLANPLANIYDLPMGSTIGPELTSMGDEFLGLSAGQWQYGGVKDMRASSSNPVKNPMLGIDVRKEVEGSFETLIGLTSQTYSIVDGSTIIEPALIFDETLQNIVLTDDYQEGDIRVYINGVRTYGIFEDIQSDLYPEFVGGIKFIDYFQLLPTDVVRVELGEYAESEIGLRAVMVNTAYGYELVNLVNNRKIEQRKSESNQYPQFALRDIYGNRLNIASPIFQYKEDDSYPVNSQTLKRIVNDSNTDYAFVQKLSDADTGRLYCYYDHAEVGDELQTIWKRGLNNEQYVPAKVDGEWEMPNQWYYNPEHKNYTEMRLTEIFRHFKSIIDLQTQPGLYSKTGGLFYLDDEINYGIGGTIKEHNESFDTLTSSIFVNNGSPVTVINFAKKQYESQIRYVKDRFYQDIASLFTDVKVSSVNELTTHVIDSMIDMVENNGKFDQWFGDSTSYANGVGVRNWIATTPQFGITKPVAPSMVHDTTLGIYTVFAHDGSRIDVSFDAALREQLIRRATSKSVTLHHISPQDGPFPTEIKGEKITSGVYLIDTNTLEKTRTLYRSTDLAVWEKLDLNEVYANTVLEIEKRLYAVAVADGVESRYNFKKVEENVDFNSIMEEQFAAYAKDNNLSHPLSNRDRFTQNNPFTWNYYFSPVNKSPIDGNPSNETAGTWQALYTIYFGTPYPHLEPWVLQGYAAKPVWWDTEYASTVRRWKAEMWNNVLEGIVPVTGKAPNGAAGTGIAGQVQTYVYLPINIGDVTTDDEKEPDELLPPYWNSVNTTNPKIRGLYDPNSEEFPVTPSADFEFGQDGLVEWQWKTSQYYNYDLMVAAFKIDPVRFLHSTIGIDYQLVSCLQISKETEKVYSHKDIIFHGDYVDSTKDVYKAFGLNQWYVHYNRYSGFDGISSEFRGLWRDWDPDLSYLFGAFIDTPSFRINSDFFDITKKDYEIAVKKTKGIDDKWLQAIDATIMSVPSQYSRLRDKGIGWTAEFTPISPVNRPISYFGVQNYSFNAMNDKTMRLYSYPMTAVGYDRSRPFQLIEFGTPLALSSASGLAPQTEYTVAFDIDGNVVSGVVESADTVDEVLIQIRDILSTSGEINLKDGNLIVYATANDSVINIVNDNVFASMTAFVGVKPPMNSVNEFNKYFTVDGNVSPMFAGQSHIVITGSTYFNGKFTLDRTIYNATTMTTQIFIKEDISLPLTGEVTVDGLVEPANAITLPDEWITGTNVYFNTTGYLPSSIDEEIPYYLIRLNDREFSVADTPERAILGEAVVLSGKPLGESFIGRIDTTFTVMGGARVDHVWRKHMIDTRNVIESSNLSISGIQLMVDFLEGHSAYLESKGFKTRTKDGLNKDAQTGQTNSWYLEIEKFIDWMYGIRNFNQEAVQSYEVSTVTSSDSFYMTSGRVPNWATGTMVVLRPNELGELPAEFDTPFSASIPYYVIRIKDDNTQFRLAATLFDAMRGNAIPLSGSNFGPFRVQLFKQINDYPQFELNPYKSFVWVEHAQGVLANVLNDDYSDPYYAARLYDNDLIEMNVKDILVYRRDTESRISMTEDTIEANIAAQAMGKPTRHISGMHLFFDGYEHILRFNDRSVDGSLIYDSFFGLNTPRFYVEFDRQQNFTLRPNVGGFVMQGDTLVQNFESITNDMRYFYDAVIAPEGRVTTNLVRQQMGYDGPKKYLDDLKINAKTQFQFWLGLIQNKGTNKSVDAFVNQTHFESASVDEFWAYKLGDFGANAERNYLEMRMFPSDSVKNELRIEFVAPENVSPDRTFQSVQLTDMTRWWKQPDQIEDMIPYESFFFNAKVDAIIDEVNIKAIDVDGRKVYINKTPMNGVILTYVDPATRTVKTLVKDIEYKFLNSRVIEFLVDPLSLPKVTMSVMNYDYNAHTPSKLIDKGLGQVKAILPVWNPANGEYLARAMSIVDLKLPHDPASYTHSIDGSNVGPSTWKNDYTNLVWLDDSLESYVPYYDETIYPNISDRISRWGNLSPWGKFRMYQWTTTRLDPVEYEDEVRRQSTNIRIPNDTKLTGVPYKKLYQNIYFEDPNFTDMPPLWVEIKDEHTDFIAGLVGETEMVALGGKTVEVFINGVFKETMFFETRDSVSVYFKALRFGDYCHTLIKAPVPTRDEIRNGKFMYYTPYSLEKRFDSVGGEVYNMYHYWVEEKKNPIHQANLISTLYTSTKDLNDMSDPFMIIEGFRTPDFGYGLIFGNIFDEFGYKLPYRYTQMIVKGLQGMVRDDRQFVMRMTRDFTLRDKLSPNRVVPKNKHVEWKLFRENQLEKIDRYLWDKATEALIGFRLKSDHRTVNHSAKIPSLNRILYDRLYKSDTQYGLGPEQVFTNAELSLQTLVAVLTDPNSVFEFINITDFLDRHNFKTPEDIADAMYEIYQNFSIEEVNKIFFAILHDAMSLKKEHSEIFKTSWVALQISQSVTENVNIPYDELRLVAGPGCEVEAPPPSPTPTPSPSASPSPTPMATATVTPTPSVTRSATPVPTVTPTPMPTITPTIPVTPTPVPDSATWNVVVFKSNSNG